MRAKKYQRKDDGTLEAFAKEFDRCWLCGARAEETYPPRLEIHHIARGSNREKGRLERCNLIRTCHLCHGHRLDGMKPAVQYAIKYHFDPAGFDYATVNMLRGRAHSAIDMDDVLWELGKLWDNIAMLGFPFERIGP